MQDCLHLHGVLLDVLCQDTPISHEPALSTAFHHSPLLEEGVRGIPLPQLEQRICGKALALLLGSGSKGKEEVVLS